jgi:hypothetical protein
MRGALMPLRAGARMMPVADERGEPGRDVFTCVVDYLFDPAKIDAFEASAASGCERRYEPIWMTLACPSLRGLLSIPARKIAVPGAHAALSPGNRESEPHLTAALITARDLLANAEPDSRALTAFSGYHLWLLAPYRHGSLRI